MPKGREVQQLNSRLSKEVLEAMTQEQRFAVLHDDVISIADTVDRMCKEQHAYAEKYTDFLDMLIAEKNEQRQFRRDMMKALSTNAAWGLILCSVIGIGYYLKHWLGIK